MSSFKGWEACQLMTFLYNKAYFVKSDDERGTKMKRTDDVFYDWPPYKDPCSNLVSNAKVKTGGIRGLLHLIHIYVSK